VELLEQIPYDPLVTEAMVRGLPVTAYRDGEVADALKSIWKAIKERLLSTGTAHGTSVLEATDSSGTGMVV
jgi:hypothetical protein